MTHFKNNRGFGLLAVVLIGAIVGVIGYILVYSNNSISQAPSRLSKISDIAKKLNPPPTPFPFEELTIPYFRNREFVSKLGELSQVSENTSYTSYLTSYDSDGLKVNGLLTIPKGSVPGGGWPAVVFVHGYIPPASYRTLENYTSYIDPLARAGLVVFKIDLRGHGQSEGDPGGGYYSGDYVIDTLNAKAALAATDFVNPSQIGLWGHSMAGNVVFRSFVSDPAIQKIVIWAGAVYTYSDLSQFGIDDDSYRPPSPDSPRQRERELLRETHGDFDPQSEFWRKVVPVNYLGGVVGEVQIHHAIDDNVVSIDYSRNLIDILSGTEIEGTLFDYSSGGHNLTGASFTTAMQRSREFLTNY